ASIFVSVVTLHPIILAYTPPPEEKESFKWTLERFMSWMVAASLTWLCWLYDYIPGVIPAALLVIGLVGVALEMVPGVILPFYGQVGMAISKFTDAFGIFFGHVYDAIERFLVWIAMGWRRIAMGLLLVALLAVGVYYQQQLKVGDTTPGAALL